jgi:hypothetical protein
MGIAPSSKEAGVGPFEKTASKQGDMAHRGWFL